METRVWTGEEPEQEQPGRSLQAILANGYETRSVEYIQKGFELFKQEPGLFIGFLFVMFLAYAAAGMLPVVGKFSGIFLAPLGIGGFLMAKRIDKNEPREFSHFFDGKTDYRELVLMVLIQTLLMYALNLIALGPDRFMVFMGWRQPEVLDFTDIVGMYSGAFKRYAIIWLPMMIISTMWIFASFFIVFARYKAWDAMEASRKVVFKKFFNWLGFLFLLGLFNVAGAICLVVGLLVTVPTSMCAVYVAFEDVVGVDVRP